MSIPLHPRGLPGERILWWATVGTSAFTLTALVATAAGGPPRVVALVVAVGLFSVGTVVFLVAFARAVARSRFEQIGVGGLYFLAGCAPAPVRRHLMGALAVQTVVGVATASIRPFTTLAFGVLVPMFGLGCAGLWGAFHGTFPARDEPRASLPADD